MKNTIVTSCLFRKIFADVRFVNLSANDTFYNDNETLKFL